MSLLVRPILIATAALAGAAFPCAQGASTAPAGDDWLDAYRQPAARLIESALGDHAAWERLAELTDTFGARLAGSENLERAIEWAVATMKMDGLENVRAEDVMVPHWVRGRESLS
jgi:carboxypeptidase Q